MLVSTWRCRTTTFGKSVQLRNEQLVNQQLNVPAVCVPITVQVSKIPTTRWELQLVFARIEDCSYESSNILGVDHSVTGQIALSVGRILEIQVINRTLAIRSCFDVICGVPVACVRAYPQRDIMEYIILTDISHV